MDELHGRSMMRALGIVAVVGLMWLGDSVAVPARWIPLDGVQAPESVRMVVRSEGSDRIIIEMTIRGVWLEDVPTNAGTFVRLQVPDGGIAGDVGRPEIAAIRKLIAIPEGGSVFWEVIEKEEQVVPIADLAAKPLYPMQPPVEKRPGALANAPFVWDRDYYARDQWAPATDVEIGERGYLRAYPYVPITVYPVMVNPQRSEVGVIHRLVVRLQVQGADMAATRNRILRSGTLANRVMAHGVLTIPPSLESLDELPTPPLGYLIITDPLYAPSSDLQEFVEWKSQKGYQVTVATTNETGATLTQIQNYIQTAYDTWEVPPVHVLLIGDTDDIPYYVATTPEHPGTDLYYACLAGTDYFADVGLGRISVLTPIQLGYALQKILSYERVEWSGNDDWESHASFMASTDNWEISEAGHNFVITSYFDPAGYTSDRFYTYTYGATIGQVIAALNQGRSLLTYSGHGEIMGWIDGPAMNQNQVRGLVNQVYPFVCSFACDVGQFPYAECFGETWIRDQEAGLAFWGSSATSLWDQDDILERRLYEGFFDNQFPGDSVNFTWLSGMTNYAKLRLYEYYGNTELIHRYFEIYNLLGDPSVDLWTEVPNLASVNHPAVIHVGDPSVEVTVDIGASPVEYAMVCVLGDQVWGSGYTDASGTAVIEFEEAPSNPGILHVYVTGHNLHPDESTLQVITASGPFVSYRDCHINDPSGNNNGQLDYNESVTLDLTVENLGSQPASNVVVTLRCDDDCIVITDSVASYGSIAVEQQVTVEDAFAFQVSANVDDNQEIAFVVVATSNEGSWETSFAIMTHAPQIVCTSILVDDISGNQNGILDPGETGNLVITVTNSGSVVSTPMAAHLTTLEAMVSIPFGTGNFAALSPEAQATDSFVVAASTSCPLGYPAGLILTVEEASTGREDIDRFELVIGDEAQLPTGPDGYGYVAYDSRDITGAPEYEWIEINSHLGGPGTFADIVGDDQTLQFDLPFAFRYYGEEYQDISICSNGWIAFGGTSVTTYTNTGIPDPDGPDRMVAPYWDDLSPLQHGTIWIWLDVSGGRFVVEYYEIAHWSPPNEENTLQVILYDPDVHPTATGDGMILFQYQTANGMTSATIGIENADQTDGIQYLFDGDYDPHATQIAPETAILFLAGVSQTPGTVSGVAALLGGNGNVQEVEIYIGLVMTNPSGNGAYLLTQAPSGLQTLIASLYGYGAVMMPNLMVPPAGALSGIDVNLPYLDPPSSLTGSAVGDVVLLEWQETAFPEQNDAGSLRRTQSSNQGLDESLEFVGYRIYRNAVCIDSVIQETEYGDVPPQNGTYDYHVAAEYTLGVSDSTNHVSVLYQGSNVPSADQRLVPERFALHQNYPNPFNPRTTIPFDLVQPGKVTIEVFNVLGQRVAVVLEQPMAAGFHRITWDGSQAASGVYFFHFVVRQGSATIFEDLRKAILLR